MFVWKNRLVSSLAIATNSETLTLIRNMGYHTCPRDRINQDMLGIYSAHINTHTHTHTHIHTHTHTHTHTDSARFGRVPAGFGRVRVGSAGFGRVPTGFGRVRPGSGGFGWVRADSGRVRVGSAGFGWVRPGSGGFGRVRVVPCLSMYGSISQFDKKKVLQKLIIILLSSPV